MLVGYQGLLSLILSAGSMIQDIKKIHVVFDVDILTYWLLKNVDSATPTLER